MRSLFPRIIVAGFSSVGLMSGIFGSVAAQAEPRISEPNERIEFEINNFEFDLPKDPQIRRKLLLDNNFVKTHERLEYGRKVETFRKSVPEGIAVEYDVISNAGELNVYEPKWNVEWDWGPRLYMTGEEFWSLGATGFSSAICSVFGGIIGGVACGVVAELAWNKLANGTILDDPQCYDLSQALNIGWEKAPAHKCD